MNFSANSVKSNLSNYVNIKQANRVEPEETAPAGAVSLGSTLFENAWKCCIYEEKSYQQTMSQFQDTVNMTLYACMYLF